MKSEFLSRLCDLFSCSSDQNQLFDLSVKRIDPFIICRIFIISSTDQYRWAVHCLDSLDRSIRVRSLGIIIINNAVFFCHKFNPMLYSLKFLQGLSDDLNRYSISCCHRCCCHRIFMIMRTENIQFIDCTDLCLFTIQAQHDLLSVQIDSLFQYTLAAEI